MTAYKTPQAFIDLYFDFTGYTHPNYPVKKAAIAQDLAAAMGNGDDSKVIDGPLVIATATGIYVYDAKEGHRLLSSNHFRAGEDTGFYEITGISHLGPAIAYLATIKEMGENSWKKHIESLLTDVKKVRLVNAAPIEQNWLTALSCPAWVGKERRIRDMVEYACALAEDYLVKIHNNPERLSAADAVKYFLAIETDSFPIPFNTIMIGTFSLATLASIYNIYFALNRIAIDWKNAKIILHNQAGTNYGAGLTEGSNWLYSVILAIAGAQLNPKRIIIAPYATIPQSIGHERLSERDYNILSNDIWGAIYSRQFTAEKVFSYIDDITIPRRAPIPGDYHFTKVDQIDHFLMRLKFSTGNPKEMLSNTVGFWIAGEVAAKDWDFSRVDLPGFTHGFPKGLKAYPSI